jgi:hypothetical protein
MTIFLAEGIEALVWVPRLDLQFRYVVECKKGRYGLVGSQRNLFERYSNLMQQGWMGSLASINRGIQFRIISREALLPLFTSDPRRADGPLVGPGELKCLLDVTRGSCFGGDNQEHRLGCTNRLLQSFSSVLRAVPADLTAAPNGDPASLKIRLEGQHESMLSIRIGRSEKHAGKGGWSE